MYKFLWFFIFLAFASCKSSQNGNSNSDGNHLYTNELINESSPYLLQHAHNPVNWYPWGDEALAKAKAEDKMIIVSVGYSACHWCHVMEHESFEDTTVSKIMNENFVCIKVDREERPDIDDVYMTACHLASGRGCGWPLNAFALPDGRPMWAGTYFPKKDWLSILENFIKLKNEKPEDLKDFADQLEEGIQQQDNIVLNGGDQIFKKESLTTIGDNFLKNIDFKKGGRTGAPKFPMPNNYEFLLAYHHYSGNEKVLEATTTTLDEMAMGGIYDHIGGGFARYSTDVDWFAPHFEKMLYDNSQLVSLYSEAYQVTKNPLYKKVVVETLDYIQREMTNPDGGFYSSIDADSEGEEGKFYVWKKSEIDSLLGESAKIFNAYYEVKKSGNWEHGNNILFRKSSDEKIAKKFNLTTIQLHEKINVAKATLMAARDKRIRPGLDDKILTSWNALMITGYTDAYRAFGDQAYLNAAIKNANFLLKNALQSDYRLNRNYKDGKSVINAFLDDYAILIDAFVHLYQVTFDEQWLNHAKELTNYVNTNFFDVETGMFFYTSNLDPPLVARKKELADNVIPASNSIMARNLFNLGTILYVSDWVDQSKQMLHNMSETVTMHPQPNFYSNWCNLYLSVVNPPYEVAVMGDNSSALSKQLLKNYLPNALVLGGKSEGSLKLLKDKLIEGETRIYVCQNKVCKFPVTEVEKALELMDD